MNTPQMKIQIGMKKIKSTSSPEVWGPSAWLILHVFALNYPERANVFHATKCKNFIDGFIEMIPCQACHEHAKQYLRQNESKMDQIVSGRSNLFKFFVGFHNYVNVRYGKRQITEQEALEMYGNGAYIQTINYDKI